MSSILPKTFHGQIVALYSGLTISVLIVASLILFWSLYYWSYADLDRRLRDELYEMRGSFTYSNDRFHILNDAIWHEEEHKGRNASAYFIQIYDEYKQIQFKTENIGNNSFPFLQHEKEISRESTQYLDEEYADQQIRLLIEPVYEGEHFRGWIEIACFSFVNSFLTPLRNFLVFTVVFASFLAVLGGLALSKRALQPLNNVIKKIKDIHQNNLKERIDITLEVHDEIAALSTTLNELLTRLENAFQRITQFTSNASHELQTPLTVIKDEAEVILLRTRSQEEYEQAVRKILAETESMIAIVRSLLLLARADNNTLVRENELLDLRMLLHDECMKIRNFAEQKHQTLHFTPESDDEMFLMFGDDRLLKEVYHNLFMNAVHYTHEHGEINISLSTSSDKIRLTIRDNGIGISDKDISHVYERFYRVQNDEVQKIKGSGLGLSIVKMIVENHQGTVSIQSKLGEGTTVIVEFPEFKQKSVPVYYS